MENAARWKFTNTATGRGYMEADIDPATAPTLHIATTQLESPDVPAAQTRSVERYTQAEQAIAALSSATNVVLGGDMSWDDRTDMPFPLPAAGGWAETWTALIRPHDSCCYTYDGIWNEDVTVFNGFAAEASSLRRRSDRFVCKLQDYKLGSIELIGREGIGIQYLKLKGGGSHWDSAFLHLNTWDGRAALHLRPSCHFGVVLTVVVPDEPPPRHDPPAAAVHGGASQAAGQNWEDSWDDDDDDY